MSVRYLHVADDLRRRITTGAIPPGGRLPSEEELASDYRVGKPTLRRALEVLQAEGLVDKFHGRGNFVRRPLQRITYTGGEQASTARVAPTSLDIDVSVIEVEAHGDLSSLMRVPVGTPLVEYVYLSAQEGFPRSLARVYLPHRLEIEPPGTSWSPWGYDLREQLGASGVEFAVTTERVAARLPTTEEVAALRIPARTCVLAIERTSTDVAGQVVEGAFLVLPGDRAQAVFTASTSDRTGAGR